MTGSASKIPLQADSKHNRNKSSSKKARPVHGTADQVGLEAGLEHSGELSPNTLLSEEAMLALQKTAGNNAVAHLLNQRSIQAKLTVSATNDAYEQEADRVANRVASDPLLAENHQQQSTPKEEDRAQTEPLATSISRLAQRETASNGEPAPSQAVDLRDSFKPGTNFEDRLATTQGAGKPLSGDTRNRMEQHFGVDFSGVRLHTGSQSAQMNREINAQAFTKGQDIYLGEGKENVESGAGMRLLAHELTHTVQQSLVSQKQPNAPATAGETVRQKSPSANLIKSAVVSQRAQIQRKFKGSRAEVWMLIADLKQRGYTQEEIDVLKADEKEYGTKEEIITALNAKRTESKPPAPTTATPPTTPKPIKTTISSTTTSTPAKAPVPAAAPPKSIKPLVGREPVYTPDETFRLLRSVWEKGRGRDEAARLCPGYSTTWTLLQKVEAINIELAKKNMEVIAKSLGYSPGAKVPASHIKNIQEQFSGMSTTGSTSPAAARVLSDYTKSEYENVTAYMRGSYYNKSTKRLEPVASGSKMWNRGKEFLEKLDEQWDNGPIAEGFPTVWRVESGPPGEIAGRLEEEGGRKVFRGNGKYKKGNTASTSAVQPIAERVDQPDKVLLEITNSKHNDPNYRQPLDLRRLSFYPEEGEILYPGDTVYEVTGTTTLKFKGKDIPVAQVKATPPAKKTPPKKEAVSGIETHLHE